jgi:hemoglobin
MSSNRCLCLKANGEQCKNAPSKKPHDHPTLCHLHQICTEIPLSSTITAQTAGNPEPSLYDRLGGIYAIAAVIDHFSEAILCNSLVGRDSPNSYLRDWHRNQLDRLPGLKWMRTLWVCDVAGGPYHYIATVPGHCPLSLEVAHKKFQISPKEFDEVAKELANSLDHFKIPEREKNEVLSAFSGHKTEVNQGYCLSQKKPVAPIQCPFRSL